MDIHLSHFVPTNIESIQRTPVKPYGTGRAVAGRTRPEDEWTGHFAAYRARRSAPESDTADIDYDRIEPIPEAERTLTTIREVEKLPRREGAYARLDHIRWVHGKWETDGPCEQARPHYDAWQAAPKGRDAAEHFYDALFEELRMTGRFFELVEKTMADWRKSGRLARLVHLYQLAYPGRDDETAEKEIRSGLLAWQPPAGTRLEQRYALNVLSETDHRARRLPEIRPAFAGWSLKLVAAEWDWWHSDNVRQAADRGEPFDAGREARVLNKMLILKQVLDVELARSVAVRRVIASRKARDDF